LLEEHIMPVLSNPSLRLELVSGTSDVKVTAAVRVKFDPVEEAFIKLLGLKFKLRCNVRGEDGGFNGPDDALFSIASKIIVKDDTYTFMRKVNRDSLDEDWEGNDEIYARFRLASTTPSLPMAAVPVDSPTITGNF
jgi:hypothetical protein